MICRAALDGDPERYGLAEDSLKLDGRWLA